MEQELTRTIGIVVVAAGRGERAGASVEGPKQYRRIGGRPVLWHTLHRLLDWPRTGPIVVVIHPDDQSLFDAVRAQLPAESPVFSVAGGATRQISVQKGLKALEPHGIGEDQIPTAFNVFMNVVVAGDGTLTVEPPLSRAGDHVLFEAEQDLIVALTACSALQSNNYAFKPIHYQIEA